MNVLVLTGSPHPKGATALLADAFCQGAKEAGHEAVRFDTANLNIHPCTGCDFCLENGGACVFEDDMGAIYARLPQADAVVLVTPLYYFGMTAQLKRVVDRFYAVNEALCQSPKRLLLIAAGADTEDWAMAALRAHVQALCRYLGWQEGGKVLALGAGSREEAENSPYPAAARNLGFMLR